MWILLYLHFPLSSTPLILQSGEKNRVGGKLHLPLILQSWEGGNSWGEIAFTPIVWIGGFRIKDVGVQTDCICRQDEGSRLDSAESLHLYIDLVTYC